VWAAARWQLQRVSLALVYNLVSPERLHLWATPRRRNVSTTEWVDNFVSLVPSQILNISDGVTDRIDQPPTRLYGAAQKGVRVMEGLNVNAPPCSVWSFG
jgi:hypothetical protein